MNLIQLSSPAREVKRLIVENVNGVCVLNQPLVNTTTDDLLKLHPSQFGPYRVTGSIKLDDFGCALMKVFR